MVKKPAPVTLIHDEDIKYWGLNQRFHGVKLAPNHLSYDMSQFLTIPRVI
jgi:hypothetical protein